MSYSSLCWLSKITPNTFDRDTLFKSIGPDNFDLEVLEVLIGIFNSDYYEISEDWLKLASAGMTCMPLPSCLFWAEF